MLIRQLTVKSEVMRVLARISRYDLTMRGAANKMSNVALVFLLDESAIEFWGKRRLNHLHPGQADIVKALMEGSKYPNAQLASRDGWGAAFHDARLRVDTHDLTSQDMSSPTHDVVRYL